MTAITRNQVLDQYLTVIWFHRDYDTMQIVDAIFKALVGVYCGTKAHAYIHSQIRQICMDI